MHDATRTLAAAAGLLQAPPDCHYGGFVNTGDVTWLRSGAIIIIESARALTFAAAALKGFSPIRRCSS
jgi:hypothetical protein